MASSAMVTGAARFKKISIGVPPDSDGALDALVCATTVYLYHRLPRTLLHLREEKPGADSPSPVRGWGPFYVIAPRGCVHPELALRVVYPSLRKFDGELRASAPDRGTRCRAMRWDLDGPHAGRTVDGMSPRGRMASGRG